MNITFCPYYLKNKSNQIFYLKGERVEMSSMQYRISNDDNNNNNKSIIIKILGEEEFAKLLNIIMCLSKKLDLHNKSVLSVRVSRF
jgi:hypothetical protein